MKGLARFWQQLPLPVQVLLGIVVGFALFQALSGFGWLLIVLAALLWALALAGLAYAAGWLRPAGPPRLVAALDRFTGGQAPTAPDPQGAAAPRTATPAAPAPRPSSAPPDEAERKRMFQAARAALEELRGVDQAMEGINDLITQIDAQRKRGASGFGSEAPGLVFLIAGPRGVGKSTLARQLAPLFCGLGALGTARTVTAQPADLSPRAGGASVERVRALAEGALDGVLLLEDMDWLVHDDSAGFTAAPDLGPTLDAVAQANPGRLAVALTMSRAAADRLQNDPERGGWLRKLLVQRIDFAGLEPEVLTEMLLAQLARARHRPAPEVAQRVLNLLERLAKAPDFDNATAVRRLADAIMQQAAIRSAQDGTSADTPYSITKADVRA